MAFGLNNDSHSYLCANHKRCFLILLFLNSLLGCIYYLHGQNLLLKLPNGNSYAKQTDTNLYQKQTNAVHLIRNILENEYDHQDLMTFYQLVENEFASGLRCTRNSKQPSSIPSNLTGNPKINNNTITIRYLNGFYICFLPYTEEIEADILQSHTVSLVFSIAKRNHRNGFFLLLFNEECV